MRSVIAAFLMVCPLPVKAQLSVSADGVTQIAFSGVPVGVVVQVVNSGRETVTSSVFTRVFHLTSAM